LRPPIDFIVSTAEGPEPLVVEFTPVSEKSIALCLWTFGDGEASDRISRVHVYRAPGAYTVRLVAEFVDGTTATIEKHDFVDVRVSVGKGDPQYIYWIDWWKGGIWRGPRAGGQAERIVAAEYHSFRALTVADGWIYWADDTDATICQAELDGSHVEIHFTDQHFISDLEVVPEGEAIFWVAHPGQIYEWDDHNGGIRFAFIGDSEPQILLSCKPNAERYADQIEVDLAGNRLYWTIQQYGNTWLSGGSAPNSTD
jgi:PKD repeat protein